MALKPWRTNYGQQRNSNSPAVDDLYRSPDVFVNGVPVVLYDVPGESPGAAAVSLATVSLDEVYFSEGPEAAASHIQTLVTAGIMSQAQVDAGKAAISSTNSDTADSAFTGTSITADCKAIHGLTSFPDSTVLTPNGTTLGDMIRKVTFSTHNIVAQKGLSKDQIICNLANLAQNIWEPLKAQFSDVFITNSFREGERQRQHGTGQAMDIQFHKLPSNKYYERAQWMRDNLPFDQLLLECHTSGALWIHVSHYSGTGIKTNEINRVAHMIDDANFKVGLADLSVVPGVRPYPAA
jgi:hypothetical protein